LEHGERIAGKVIALHIAFGPIALLGSGETSLAGGRIFESIAQRRSKPIHIALLETPTGFELNSAQVVGRVGEFLKTRLQNYDPIVNVIAARKRGTSFSPDDPRILKSLLLANIIFMGPGSPTYAVRQLHGSLAWDLMRARHRQGAALVFASAAAIAVSEFALPVYEIYKAGEELQVIPGLGLFADFGLSLSFIPHWNNTDGGTEVDTSRCFIGIDRFAHWCTMLPADHTVIGLDEHTGLIVDFEAGKCTVSGIGSVTLLRECNPVIHPAGKVFPVEELGTVQCPFGPEEGIPAAAWKMITENEKVHDPDKVPEGVVKLAEERKQARLRKDWVSADNLRKKIEVLGWEIRDTQDGQMIVGRS
jgi:hypothetical protein